MILFTIVVMGAVGRMARASRRRAYEEEQRRVEEMPRHGGEENSPFEGMPFGGIFEEIVPYLTVARHPNPAVLAEIATSLVRHLPLETEVREVWLMEEAADGHWDRAATFPLGG